MKRCRFLGKGLPSESALQQWECIQWEHAHQASRKASSRTKKVMTNIKGSCESTSVQQNKVTNCNLKWKGNSSSLTKVVVLTRDTANGTMLPSASTEPAGSNCQSAHPWKRSMKSTPLPNLSVSGMLAVVLTEPAGSTVSHHNQQANPLEFFLKEKHWNQQLHPLRNLNFCESKNTTFGTLPSQKQTRTTSLWGVIKMVGSCSGNSRRKNQH